MLVYEEKTPWPVNINTILGNDSWLPTGAGGWNIQCDSLTTENNWGIMTWTVAGASHLMGASIVLAGLVALV